MPRGLPLQKGSVCPQVALGARRSKEDNKTSGIFHTRLKYLFVEKALGNPSHKTMKLKERKEKTDSSNKMKLSSGK